MVVQTQPRRRQRRREFAMPRDLQIEQIPIDHCIPYADNPRVNEQAIESVKNSIREFGFLVPMVIDDEFTIVAGHTRWEAARQLGMDTVPCVNAGHLTDAQLKQFRIIDNKVAELAQWDIDLLAIEVREIMPDIDLTDFGFTGDEVDSIVNLGTEDATAASHLNRRPPPTERTRAPATTRIVVGEFTAFIPTAVYRQWAGQIRTECNHDSEDITDHLMDLLGIAPYLVREDGEG